MNAPTPNPPLSSTSQNQPQDTLLQRGAFDPPFNPGTLGRLNRFEIIRLLGEGGMGQVYLAREPLTDTHVAVKIMKPQLADDPQAVHRFLTEARHMYRLSHPRILRVLEVSDRKEGPYYVMPYIAGGNLIAQCKPGEPMSAERISTIARQVAEALAHAHAHGLIHRDIKPGNILLDKEGNAFLTDFGLVRTVFNDSMVDATASHLEGTAPYMSPAVARGEAEDTRCDIYAFGAVLYELLAGQPPYTGRTPQMILDQILRGPPLPVRQVNPKADPALARIAEGCMARELRDRYASMADVVADLASAAQGAASRDRQQSRLPKLAALLVAALVVVGVIGAATRILSTMGHKEKSPAIVQPGFPPIPTVAEPTAPFDFTCTTNNGEIAITKYTGPGGDVVIPSAINGLPVTTIEEPAFRACAKLGSVTIPNSVTKVADWAFWGCPNLTSATIAAQSIGTGRSAFQECRNLTSVTISNGVSAIGYWAFGFDERLTNIYIPASVSYVCANPFHSCTQLKSITVDEANPYYSSKDGVVFNKEQTKLVCFPGGKSGSYAVPSGVTHIGGEAFWNNTLLTSITFPNSLTTIEGGAFDECSGLTNNLIIPASVTTLGGRFIRACRGVDAVVVDPANPSYSSSSDGVLFNKDKTCLVAYPGGKAGAYVIPDGVTKIGEQAFRDCTYMTSVTIPGSVATIDSGAFEACYNLTRIYFKGNVPRLGKDVFKGADKVTVFYLPGTTGWDKDFGGRPTAVWEDAPPATVSPAAGESPVPAETDPYQFACAASNGAVAIVRYTGEGGEINIPAAISGLPVTSIANEAFLDRPNVTGVMIPNSVTSIGNGAFKNCGKLAKITIPNSVTNLGGWAFEGCTSLARITIPASVPKVEWHMFYGCSNLVSILVDPLNPNYSSSADGVLFNKDKTRLLCYPAGKKGNYTIPASVTSIGVWSFRDCDNLTGITIPNGINGIDNGAFWACSSLTNVALPASVNGIYPNLFAHCTRLNSIIVDEVNPAYSSIDGVVFSKDKTKLVSYPRGRVGSYAIPTQVTSIAWASFEGTPGLTGVTIPSGVKRIEECTFKDCTNLTSVTIPNSVTSIDREAFVHCASLSSVTIPDSVTIIGWDAFLGTGLTTLTIPDSVTEFANTGAFADCTNLASVTIGNGVTKIGGWTFAGCTKLSSITIPDSVTVIGRDAFNSSGLTAITIPDSVTNLADTGAFTTCTNLTRVTMGNGTTKLGDWTFDACISLTQVVFGAEVTSIGRGAFRGCRNLCGITLPDSLKVIGWDSFKSTALTAITIPDSVTDIDMWAFVNCTNLAHITIGIGITNIARGAFESCSSLTGVYFKGNAPGGAADGSIFSGANNATVYYLPGTTGWGAEFGGRPTAVWAEGAVAAGVPISP